MYIANQENKVKRYICARLHAKNRSHTNLSRSNSSRIFKYSGCFHCRWVYRIPWQPTPNYWSSFQTEGTMSCASSEITGGRRMKPTMSRFDDFLIPVYTLWIYYRLKFEYSKSYHKNGLDIELRALPSSSYLPCINMILKGRLEKYSRREVHHL